METLAYIGLGIVGALAVIALAALALRDTRDPFVLGPDGDYMLRPGPDLSRPRERWREPPVET